MPARFLIADSDSTNLELMTAVLTRNGFEVVTTPDGCDALSRLQESPVSLLVCAERLPGIGGPELCRQVKVTSPETKVVILHEDADEIGGDFLAGELGCDAVLPPSFRYSLLRKLLVTWELIAGEEETTRSRARSPLDVALPPPVALPVELSSVPAGIAQPEPAPAPDGSLLAPIPLPVMATAPALDEELPELSLGALESGDIPELELTEVCVEQSSVPEVGRPRELHLPAASGTLEATPLPRLLCQLYLATFTGVAKLSTPAAQRQIHFLGGRPVSVDSRQLSESLGRVLVSHGRITADQYQRVLEVMAAKKIRAGEALLELGFISRSELLDALQEQTELKLCNTFAWRRAEYLLEEKGDVASGTIVTEVHPLRAIWRGVRENYDMESLMSFFHPLGSRFVVATDLYPVHYNTLGPFLRDLGVPELLDGKTRLGTMLAQSARPLELCQALYVLLVAEMVEAREQPGSPPREAASPAILQAATDHSGLAQLAETISAEYLRLKEADFLDVLNVDETASPSDVDAAYNNILSSLHLNDLPVGLPDEIVRRARELRRILGRARAVARDPGERDRYLSHRFEAMAQTPQKAHGEEEAPMPAVVETFELDSSEDRARSLAAEAAYDRGRSHLAADKATDAAREFRRAIELGSDEPAYRVGLGRAILAAHSPEDQGARMKAVACLQQALQLDPAHPDANLELAKLLVVAGNRERALVYVRRVIQKDPGHVEARKLALVLGGRG